jgi:nucleoside-triphosphatase THEP1
MGLDEIPDSGRHWLMASLALITGPIGSGKTTICSSLYVRLRDAGYLVSGLIQETRRNENGLPIRIDFRALSTGKSWPWTERKSGDPCPSPFMFPEQPLQEALACLSQAEAENRYPLILDEIGLLEIERGIGFLKWVESYLEHENSFLIASLRNGREKCFLEIIADKASHGKPLQASVFEIEGKNREACLNSALNWTLRHCPKRDVNVYL